MTATTQEFPKAFAVWFKDLERWDVSSFQQIAWHWAKEVMAPLGSVLQMRKEKVDRSKVAFSELQPITIHFDGSIDPRNVDANRAYTMELFYAHAGDIVVSKIDLKNGAVGIVPEELHAVVVTNHFAVYEPDLEKLLPDYFQLIIQAKFFKAHLWRNKVGAEGRKEVKLDFFEALEIPLPPIAIQRAIVDRWQTAQAEIKAANERIDDLEREIPKLILTELGIPYHEAVILPKAFALLWEELERWSVSYLSRMITGVNDIQKSKYEIKSLGDISKVSYGVQKCPSNRPGKSAKPYLRVANVQRGQLDLSEIKYIEVPDAEMDNLRLQKGDLLVCEGNSADLVGRPAIWNDEILDCIHQNHILKVRLNEHIALPKFVLEYMQTLPARSYFRARAKFTTNLASINSNDLREFPIPLPPLEVQKAIVQRVEVGRQAIAREREAADRKKQEIEAEIEALILGTQAIEVMEG